MIRVYVKGPPKSAKRAAQRKGIALRNCTTDKFEHGEVKCTVPCSKYRQVASWYQERDHVKAGRGHPPGALLYYAAGTCSGSGSLSGGRRRRRRRRRA